METSLFEKVRKLNELYDKLSKVHDEVLNAKIYIIIIRDRINIL